MSFAAFCLCHAFDAQSRWDALEQQILRQRSVRQWQAQKARLWRSLESQVGPGIARDIHEWRVEA